MYETSSSFGHPHWICPSFNTRLKVNIPYLITGHGVVRAVFLPDVRGMERQLLEALIDLQRQQLALMREFADGIRALTATLETVVSSQLLTKPKIYKAEAIKRLGISPRTYNRRKADGILVPRGEGHDWYYPEDLEEALTESRRKGLI